ncbi:MAG TPA: helix-turn-helix transcriptional regulator [Bacteroidia bacterium]|nr:helix-turn-helix transcriptional regulator [Bacteroidia bacterium]HRH08770.1 helix-turn-helix transcriptional regulator [Bacteroidia bacterium]
MDENEYLKLLSQKILDLRMKRGMTQVAMAEKMGTLHSQITRLESGIVNPKITMLRRVANALNVSIGELVNIENP